MDKATWRVKESKNTYRATYSGDLQEALDKAKKDLERYQNNKDIAHWYWIRAKAEAAIKANERAINRANIFIQLAEKELKAGGKSD
ncbi:hypothetical protein D7V86_19860 [bacterium D16-51]|nr:hypothetical protein D7V96_00635 [bacterium D16-59]RKI56222.1 hypothetical protein D7V86_19860 [bacterium D16-51]